MTLCTPYNKFVFPYVIHRIIILSSYTHENGTINFDDLMGEKTAFPPAIFQNPLYFQSKLANALFSKELGKRLKGTLVQTFTVCPGVVATDISRTIEVPKYLRSLLPIVSWFMKTPSEVR